MAPFGGDFFPSRLDPLQQGHDVQEENKQKATTVRPCNSRKSPRAYSETLKGMTLESNERPHKK